MNIITKIEVQKRNKERVNIFIDEEYAFGISAELVYKYNLKPKMKIDVDTLREIAEKESLIKCRLCAIRIIEKSYKTEKELHDRLLEKGYEEREIHESIKFLKQYNYINDSSYTKSFIKDKIKSQGQKKIFYDLKRKGVDEQLIHENLQSLDENTEKEIALTLARKKYCILSKRESDIYKLKQKLYRYIISRGYSYDIANEVIKEVINN